MKVLVLLYANLANLLPPERKGNSCLLDADEGRTVRDLLDLLKVPPDLPRIIFVNGLHAQEDQVLKEGDRLAVFPPIAGG